LFGLLSFFPLSSPSCDFLDEELPPKNSMIDDWERMSSELLKPPPLSPCFFPQIGVGICILLLDDGHKTYKKTEIKLSVKVIYSGTKKEGEGGVRGVDTRVVLAEGEN